MSIPTAARSAINGDEPVRHRCPRLYDLQRNYHGKLSTNPYDPDSTSNPYGRYGSPFSPDSIKNPYGRGLLGRGSLLRHLIGHLQGESERGIVGGIVLPLRCYPQRRLIVRDNTTSSLRWHYCALLRLARRQCRKGS